jgi:hypothetical protein
MFPSVAATWRYVTRLEKRFVLLLVVLPILSMVAATSFHGDDYRKLLEDPSWFTDESPFLGMFSSLGVLCWWSAAVACGIVATRLDIGHRDRVFAAYGAALSGWLCLDDLFLFHDGLLYHRLGVPEEVWFAAYVVATAIYVHRYFDVHARIGAELLVWSLGLLMASVAVDMMHLDTSRVGRASILAEEGTKFAGLCCWAAYHVRVAQRLLGARPAARSALEGNRSASEGRLMPAAAALRPAVAAANDRLRRPPATGTAPPPPRAARR